MTHFIKDYVDFLFYASSSTQGRQQQHYGTTVGEASPDFVRNTILCSIYFCALSLLLPLLARTIAPKFWASLPLKKKEEFPSYTAGFFHHIVVAPLGLLRIWADWRLWKAGKLGVEMINYAPHNADVLPFNMGYLVADTIFIALPDLVKGKYAYFLHHCGAFIMCFFLLNSKGYMSRFIPHLLITESTNLLFEIAWFLRLIGMADSTLILAVESGFVVLYLFTRVVNLPLAMWALVTTEIFSSVGVFGSIVLFAILALQFYWFGIICVKLFEKLGIKQVAKKKDKEKM